MHSIYFPSRRALGWAPYKLNCLIVFIHVKSSFHSEAVHNSSGKLQLPILSPQGKSNGYVFYLLSLVNDPYQMKQKKNLIKVMKTF